MRVRVYGEGEMRVRVNKGKAKIFMIFYMKILLILNVLQVVD